MMHLKSEEMIFTFTILHNDLKKDRFNFIITTKE